MISELKLVQCDGKLDKEFKVKGCIGNGSFGSVYKVKQKSDKSIHAVKKIKFDQIDDQFWISGIRELKALHKARSDFVVEHRTAWIEKKTLCLLMELCDCNLLDVIKDKKELFNVDSYKLSLIDYFISCEIFEEIIKSLDYLHCLSPPIIHRDIKPENILVVYPKLGLIKQSLKLCDFGYAKPHNFSGQSLTRNTGSVSYMAPEVSRSKTYDSKSDVYSLGIIGHELFGIDFDRWQKSIEKKHEQIRDNYCKLEQVFTDILQTIIRKRPSCADLLNRSQSWRLTSEEVQQINEFNDSIEMLRNSNQKFFYNFLINKSNQRMGDVCDGDQLDGPINPTLAEESVALGGDEINSQELDPKIGDIIQISYEENYEEITLWALFIGSGLVMYLFPDLKTWSADRIDNNYTLLSEEFKLLTENKCCAINNLDEFAQRRGLTAQNPNEIRKTAEKVFQKYSNQKLIDKNHNLRIHFVTKCRFGRGICPQKDSLEEETNIFKI